MKIPVSMTYPYAELDDELSQRTVILPDGTYSSGTIILPDGRTHSDFSFYVMHALRSGSDYSLVTVIPVALLDSGVIASFGYSNSTGSASYRLTLEKGSATTLIANRHSSIAGLTFRAVFGYLK